MDAKGKNILPMIGFIIIISVVFTGFILFRDDDGNKASDINISDSNNTKINTTGTNVSVTEKFGGYEVDEKGQIYTNGIDKILVNAVGADVNIITHNKENVAAHLYGNVKTISKEAVPYLEVIDEGKTAAVRVKYPQIVNPIFLEDLQLDVFVPEDWLNDLDISTVSGDISTKRVTGGNITIKTTSAKITAQEVVGKEVTIQTVSGGIDVEMLNAENAYFKSTSGNFKIGKAVVSDVFEKRTASGECQIDELECNEAKIFTNSGNTIIKAGTAESVESESVSGEIAIQMKKGSAEFKTTSGDIKTEFTESFDLFKVKSVSGGVNLTIPENSQFSLDIDSVSGNISCNDFAIKISSSDNNKLEGTVGNGQSKIDINTTSGKVMIRKQ